MGNTMCQQTATQGNTPCSWKYPLPADLFKGLCVLFRRVFTQGILTQQGDTQEVRDDKGNLVNRMVRESSQAQKSNQHGILLVDRATVGLQQDPRVHMILCTSVIGDLSR